MFRSFSGLNAQPKALSQAIVSDTKTDHEQEMIRGFVFQLTFKMTGGSSHIAEAVFFLFLEDFLMKSVENLLRSFRMSKIPKTRNVCFFRTRLSF